MTLLGIILLFIGLYIAYVIGLAIYEGWWSIAEDRHQAIWILMVFLGGAAACFIAATKQ